MPDPNSRNEEGETGAGTGGTLGGVWGVCPSPLSLSLRLLSSLHLKSPFLGHNLERILSQRTIMNHPHNSWLYSNL